jgi:hypothetical protein
VSPVTKQPKDELDAWVMGRGAANRGLTIHEAQVECARKYGIIDRILDANSEGWHSEQPDPYDWAD